MDDEFCKQQKNKADFKVLDIGGNTGTVAIQIKDRGYNVTVADIAEDALSKARTRDLNTIKMDFSEIFPIPSETYDAIIAGEIIEHIFDTDKFLSECHRILKKDGVIILTTPNLATLRDRIRFLFGKMPRQINPHHEYLKLHIRQFTYCGLKTALLNNGFKIKKFKSNYLVFKLPNGKPLMIRILGKMFPKLSSSLIVLADKNN